MKKGKRLISLLLVCCLLMGCVPMAVGAKEVAFSGTCGEGVTWSYDAPTKTLVISGTGAMEDYPAETQILDKRPWESFQQDTQAVIVGPGVTAIGEFAFYWFKNLASLTISDSVEKIGTSAFSACKSLMSVNLPSSVKEIGSKAFSYCDNLNSVTLSDGLSEIRQGMFEGCGRLTSITIPKGVTIIHSRAFACTALSTVAIPDTVTEIRDSAFCDCKSLTSVSLPASVVMLGNEAFSRCGLTSVTLSGEIKAIADYTFSECYNLTTVSLPDSVTEIGNWAFASCSKLSSITIPENTSKIGEGAFYDCTSLTSLTIPDSITEIKDWTFADCSRLSSIIIPGNVSEIGQAVFSGCTNLTALTIPPSVLKIKPTVFSLNGLGEVPSMDLTIYGAVGSYAEAFAKEHKLRFVAKAFPTEKFPTGFVDVPAGQYYINAVQWAAEQGITAGTDDIHFSPNASCTRAQAVTFLWRAAGEPEPQGTAAGFTDVKAGAYYEKAVQWAVEEGITAGAGAGKFSPEVPCTRAQIVTFLWRKEGSPEAAGAAFGDVQPGAYYETAVKWAVEKKITAGTSATAFSPESKCVRAQIVSFLYRSEG